MRLSAGTRKRLTKLLGQAAFSPLHELREGFDNPKEVNIIKKADIIDLTSKFDGNTLSWDVPKGDWLVIRYGWTCTGGPHFNQQ